MHHARHVAAREVVGLEVLRGDPLDPRLHEVDAPVDDRDWIHLSQAHREHVEQADVRAGKHRLQVELRVLEEEDEEREQEQNEDDEEDRLDDVRIVALGQGQHAQWVEREVCVDVHG